MTEDWVSAPPADVADWLAKVAGAVPTSARPAHVAARPCEDLAVPSRLDVVLSYGVAGPAEHGHLDLHTPERGHLIDLLPAMFELLFGRSHRSGQGVAARDHDWVVTTWRVDDGFSDARRAIGMWILDARASTYRWRPAGTADWRQVQGGVNGLLDNLRQHMYGNRLLDGTWPTIEWTRGEGRRIPTHVIYGGLMYQLTELS